MDFRKIGFQKTVNFQTSRPINAEDLKSLPHIIYKKTGYNYAFEHTDSGCFIKPSFNRMSDRNSFVPEVNIDFQDEGGQHFLRVKGRPVKGVRIFIKIWLAFALLLEIIGIVAVAIAGIGNIIFAVFPAVLAVFGYLFFKITTKITFKSVFKIIQSELLYEGVVEHKPENHI